VIKLLCQCQGAASVESDGRCGAVGRSVEFHYSSAQPSVCVRPLLPDPSDSGDGRTGTMQGSTAVERADGANVRGEYFSVGRGEQSMSVRKCSKADKRSGNSFCRVPCWARRPKMKQLLPSVAET